MLKTARHQLDLVQAMKLCIRSAHPRAGLGRSGERTASKGQEGEAWRMPPKSGLRRPRAVLLPAWGKAAMTRQAIDIRG